MLSGWMVLLAVLVVAASFVVGLLIGEGWHRRRMARRERQLVLARRRVTELTEALRARAEAEGDDPVARTREP